MKFSLRCELPLAPLVACISLALGSSMVASAAQARTGAAMWRSGAVAVRNELHGMAPRKATAPTHTATISTVLNCADDGNAGSLRSLVANAGEGDTIDLSALTCSRITLASGAIPVQLNNLTLIGPGATALSIDGASADRVLVHGGYGTLTLSGLSIRHGSVSVSGNKITGGGCIAAIGYIRLDHSTVSDCYASGEGVYGGGIFAYSLEMYTSTLSRNVGLGSNTSTGTAVFGGGAYVNTIYLTDSTISGNRAAHDLGDGQSSYDIGGGVFANLGGEISSSTIEGNYAYGMGGGLSTFAGYTSIVNSTISGNQARTSHGGGLDLRTFYPNVVSNSTITNNRAALGGGIYLRGAATPFTLQSTLVSGNFAGAGKAADFDAAFSLNVDGANNLTGTTAAAVTLPTDTQHADPLLLALADNGGPTRTHALARGSPAIDTGNNLLALPNDQRGAGYPRAVGAPDIGAYERGADVAPPPVVALPTISRGLLGLLAALLVCTGLRRGTAKRG